METKDEMETWLAERDPAEARRWRIGFVMDAVCAEFEITKEDLVSKSQIREAADARKVLCALLEDDEELQLDEEEIAKLVKRSRGAVRACIESCDDLYRTNAEFKWKVDCIRGVISF